MAFQVALSKALKIAESLNNNNGKEKVEKEESSVARPPPPGCVWANQRKRILLTICLTDVTEPVIRLGRKKLYFKAAGGCEQKLYEVEMEFFKEIDIKRSRYDVRPREVTFILEKEAEMSWERLLATSQKQPWLRVDFKNWRDEDDSDGDDDPIIEKLLDDLNALSSEDEENDWEDLDEDEESYSYSDEDDSEDEDESYSDEDYSEDSEAADYDWRQDENCHGEELAGKIVARNIARAKQKMKMLNNLTPAQVERLNNVDLGEGEDTSGEAVLGALLGSGEEYQEALSLYRHSEMECGADCPHCKESMDLLTADMMRTLRLEDREKYEEMMKTIEDKPRSL